MASSSVPASAPAAGRKRAADAGFLKTFPSDMEDAQVHKLLLEIKTADPMYKDFTTRDLKLLASLLSALRFESGDKIVARGEEASFLGIVLKGSFACVVDDRPGVALRRGDLFGELEFLSEAPTLRKHDMVAATAGIIGVLTFEDCKLVGLTSIDLHIRLMQLIAVSSIRKIRQTTQQQSPRALGGGGGATPKVRSRRGSMTTITTNGQQQQQLSSAASSPAMPPPLSVSLRPGIGSLSLGAGIDGGSPLTPQLTQPDTPTLEVASPTVLVGDEAAIASAVAAALADSNSADSKLRRADSAPDAAAANGNLELLFRCRMKKHAHIKPRRIEAEAIELVDASLSPAATAVTGGANGVVLPPLSSKDGRSSFPGSGSSGGAAVSSPTLAATSLATSSTAASAATDKSNHNYILYALRNKVAKQEDLIEEKETSIGALTAELRAAQEQASKDAQRIAELEARQSASSKESTGSLDRIRKLELDLASVRADLARATKSVESLESERRSTQDQTAAMVAAMSARLKEHGEMLDEPASMGLGIAAAAAAAAAANSNPGSNNNSPSKSAAQDSHSKYALTRLMSSNTAISYAKYSAPRPAPAAKSAASYSAASHAALHDSLSSVTAQYDALLCKLSDRVLDQDRALTGMHKWKHRATEFATSWDVERKMLRDRIKTLLLEIEQLKTAKDSYKILLKVLTIKLFMQHSAVRRLLRGVYRKCVELTTAILIEQRASGGGGLGPEEGRMLHGRAGVTQADNADELQVRAQRKMQEKPWGGRGGGGGGGAAAQTVRPAVSPSHSTRRTAVSTRPAPLRALIESLDDELSTLVSATEGVVASKKTWQETSESFFQRNIELSQRVAQLDAEHMEASASTIKLQRELDHSRESISALELQLASLSATHKSKLAELTALSHKSSSDLRQKRTEVDALFEKTVDLKRRIREGDIAARELEQKELRLHQRNDALLAEQRKLSEAIRLAKEIEVSLARGNAKAYATLVAASAQGLALQPSLGLLSGPSLRTLRNSQSSAASIGLQQQQQQQQLQSQESQAQLAPLIGSPRAHRSGSAGGVAQNAHTQSLPQFSQTLPAASPAGSGLHTAASTGSLASPGSAPEAGAAGHSGAAAVLATIRARPSQAQNQAQAQQQQQQQLLSAAQWTALATQPPSPAAPHTARPAPPSASASASMQPLRAKRGSASGNGSQSARGADKSSAAASAAAAAAASHKRAIAAALHRDSLDRALFRAAKAGLGRSPSKPATRSPHKMQSASSDAGHDSFADESKESSSLPPLPPSTPLRDMMDTQTNH